MLSKSCASLPWSSNKESNRPPASRTTDPTAACSGRSIAASCPVSVRRPLQSVVRSRATTWARLNSLPAHQSTRRRATPAANAVSAAAARGARPWAWLLDRALSVAAAWPRWSPSALEDVLTGRCAAGSGWEEVGGSTSFLLTSWGWELTSGRSLKIVPKFGSLAISSTCSFVRQSGSSGPSEAFSFRFRSPLLLPSPCHGRFVTAGAWRRHSKDGSGEPVLNVVKPTGAARLSGRRRERPGSTTGEFKGELWPWKVRWKHGGRTSISDSVPSTGFFE